MATNYIARPVPGDSNGGQSDLEYAAIIQRNVLIPKNLYNNFDDANKYSLTHTRAITDEKTLNYGKGTGNFLDIENYGAGAGWDRNGNQNPGSIVGRGIGRNQAITLNNATWGYGPTGLDMQYYTAPDTSLNTGQVIID
jgi:hypothetical protein